MELTTEIQFTLTQVVLFMMSKIQNLNGTHNNKFKYDENGNVVYDVKDTKFEWNSQPFKNYDDMSICCL